MSPTPSVRFIRSVSYMLFCVAVGLLTIMFIYFNVNSNHLAKQIRDSQRSNTSTIAVIQDCTQTTGQCFKDGQKRTAGVLQLVRMQQVAAVACADRPGTQTAEEIDACVERTMRTIREGSK